MSTDNPIVIDLGSESVKAGYAQAVPSEQEPRIVTPSLVRVQPRGGQAAAAAAANGSSSSSSGRLVRVVERGAVRSMDCLDAMLHHLFYDQLGWVKGEEGAVLFVEPLFVGKGERELLTQLMFEGFNVAGLFLHDAASLSLAAAGKLNGCSVDIGHGKIDIATVSDGVMHAPGAVRMSFAGEQLTQVLGQCLAQQQQPGLPQLSQQQLSALKVRCCRAAPSAEAYSAMLAAPPPPYQQQHTDRHEQAAAAAAAAAVAAGPSRSSGGGGGGGQAGEQQQQQQEEEEQELPPLGAPQEYALPDGSTFTVGAEGVSTAEALFHPSPVYGLPHTPGLVDCILQCVNELPDASARRSALDGLLLCGGGACIQGISTRVQQELRAQLPSGLHPRMASLPEYMCVPSPQYVPWVGGAVMAKLAAYQSHFMIKAEYEECGASCVHRKCA